MPRPLRIEFENAWYHVMNRGAGYQPIYKTKKDRLIFLEILSETCELFGIEIHAYCLMDNHYHLLIKTPRGNLGRAMRHINGVYTQRFNRLRKKDGPLFRGRYKAIIVEEDNYLLYVSRYIHLNPVAAKIVKSPHDYIWSSYQYYLKTTNKPKWLQIDKILLIQTQKIQPNTYIRFVEDGLDLKTKTFYQRLHTPVIFGTAEFKDKLLRKLEEKKIEDSPTDYKHTREVPTAALINKTIMNYLNLDEEEFYKNRGGKNSEARRIVIYGCRIFGSEKLSSIAERYRYKSCSTISNIVNSIKKQMKSDQELQKMILEIQILLVKP